MYLLWKPHNFYDAKNYLSYLDSYLEEAGADYSALDPTGQKSAEEMEAVVQEAFVATSINNARLLFTILQVRSTKIYKDSHVCNPVNRLETIRSSLADAETDYSALDPTGKKSADEMEDAVQVAFEGAQLNFATAQLYNQEKNRLYS